MASILAVKEIMVEASLSLLPEMEAYEAVDLVVSKKLTGVPVVDEDGALVGFLTEKDCLRLQVTSHQYNMTGRRVRDIMSDIKESLRPDMDLLSAATQFLACNFATLPVMEGSTLVGSISRQNMLKAIKDMHRERGRNMQQDKHDQKLMDNPSSIDEFQALVGKSSKEQLATVLGRRHS